MQYHLSVSDLQSENTTTCCHHFDPFPPLLRGAFFPFSPLICPFYSFGLSFPSLSYLALSIPLSLIPTHLSFLPLLTGAFFLPFLPCSFHSFGLSSSSLSYFALSIPLSLIPPHLRFPTFADRGFLPLPFLPCSFHSFSSPPEISFAFPFHLPFSIPCPPYSDPPEISSFVDRGLSSPFCSFHSFVPFLPFPSFPFLLPLGLSLSFPTFSIPLSHSFVPGLSSSSLFYPFPFFLSHIPPHLRFLPLLTGAFFPSLSFLALSIPLSLIPFAHLPIPFPPLLFSIPLSLIPFADRAFFPSLSLSFHSFVPYPDPPDISYLCFSPSFGLLLPFFSIPLSLIPDPPFHSFSSSLSTIPLIHLRFPSFAFFPFLSYFFHSFPYSNFLPLLTGAFPSLSYLALSIPLSLIPTHLRFPSFADRGFFPSLSFHSFVLIPTHLIFHSFVPLSLIPTHLRFPTFADRGFPSLLSIPLSLSIPFLPLLTYPLPFPDLVFLPLLTGLSSPPFPTLLFPFLCPLSRPPEISLPLLTGLSSLPFLTFGLSSPSLSYLALSIPLSLIPTHLRFPTFDRAFFPSFSYLFPFLCPLSLIFPTFADRGFLPFPFLPCSFHSFGLSSSSLSYFALSIPLSLIPTHLRFLTIADRGFLPFLSYLTLSIPLSLIPTHLRFPSFADRGFLLLPFPTLPFPFLWLSSSLSPFLCPYPDSPEFPSFADRGFLLLPPTFAFPSFGLSSPSFPTLLFPFLCPFPHLSFPSFADRGFLPFPFLPCSFHSFGPTFPSFAFPFLSFALSIPLSLIPTHLRFPSFADRGFLLLPFPTFHFPFFCFLPPPPEIFCQC
ncbi:unnamed protein product [Acanthosepion pharaonis]|uniref:Uncharacterized protein n=1 Tax=Acanthosepion pharaonis TaxID=158019 RepID=A0A812DXG7_ACAPH|nr:unnamed protein product [Sepia pharaonis]